MTRQAEEIDEDISEDLVGGSLFFSLTITPNSESELSQPEIPGHIIHITNACFGERVNKGSRTVVQCISLDEKKTPICVLSQGIHENHRLDLLFNEGAGFSISGQKPSPVTLTGHYQPDFTPENPELEDQLNDQEIRELIRNRELEGVDEKDLEEEQDAEQEAEAELEPTQKVVQPKVERKRKRSEVVKQSNGGQAGSDLNPPPAKRQAVSEESGAEKKKKKKSKKMTEIKGGLKYRDMKSGSGQQVAQKGNKLTVYYVGQLTDNSVFDKCITGRGFSFTLGAGEVIKGWELGLVGMKVGAKRKLHIPSKFGYGKAGSPPTIGANADLVFTVELKSIE